MQIQADVQLSRGSGRSVSPVWMITAVVVLAAIVRIMIAVQVPYPGRDELVYCHCAELWRQSGGEAVYALPYMTIPPLFIWLIQLGMKISGCGAYHTGLAISLFCGVVLVVMSYKLSSLLWSPKVGIGAALLAALHPELIEFSCRVWRESLYLALIAAAFFFFFSAVRRNRLIDWLICGFFIGLGCSVRFEGVELILCFIMALLLNKEYRKLGLLMRCGGIFLLGMGIGVLLVILCCQLSLPFLGRIGYERMIHHVTGPR